MYRSPIGRIKFLFMAPLILVLLVVINLTMSPGEWWAQWAALGLGIVWVITLITLLRAAVLIGGLAALIAYVARRSRTWHPRPPAARGTGLAM